MKQNIKSNYILAIIITVIMCMMCGVITYATSIMGTQTQTEDLTETQQDFYSYLYVMASYNEVADAGLSFDDFENSSDKTQYETAFNMINQQSDQNLSVQGLEDAAEKLKNRKRRIRYLCPPV